MARDALALRAYYISMNGSSRAPGLLHSLHSHGLNNVTRIRGFPLLDHGLPTSPAGHRQWPTLTREAAASLWQIPECRSRVATSQPRGCTQLQPWCCASQLGLGLAGPCAHEDPYAPRSKGLAHRSYAACSKMTGHYLACSSRAARTLDHQSCVASS